MARPVGRDSLVFEDIRLMVIAPARSAVVFYRTEFTFPLGVAHAVSTISHQAQRQSGYRYGRQQD